MQSDVGIRKCFRLVHLLISISTDIFSLIMCINSVIRHCWSQIHLIFYLHHVHTAVFTLHFVLWNNMLSILIWVVLATVAEAMWLISLSNFIQTFLYYYYYSEFLCYSISTRFDCIFVHLYVVESKLFNETLYRRLLGVRFWTIWTPWWYRCNSVWCTILSVQIYLNYRLTWVKCHHKIWDKEQISLESDSTKTKISSHKCSHFNATSLKYIII